MELVYQNRNLITKENVNEFFRVASPKWKSTLILPVVIILTGLLMYVEFKLIHYIIYSFLLAAYTFWFLYVGVKRSEKLYYNRLTVNKLDDRERIVEFAEDITVLSPSTGSRSVYEYSHVYKFIESKNIYVLILPHMLGIILEKDRFTKGNEAEFKAFIKSKCMHLRKLC